MDWSDFPLGEFDASPEAVLQPGAGMARVDMPEHAVLCFFADVVDEICLGGGARLVTNLKTEIGKHPIYEVGFPAESGRRKVAVLHPGVGAPLAAAFLEEVIALGGSKVVACGGAGALVPELALGSVVVPTSAVRDEGTSFHYVVPSRYIDAAPAGVRAAQAVLARRDVPYISGRTWTTDAIYRETHQRVARRRDEDGCVTVEMETAAFFAVAQMRGIEFAQLLYAGDSLAGAAWHSRSWQSAVAVRKRLFWLAAEVCLNL